MTYLSIQNVASHVRNLLHTVSVDETIINSWLEIALNRDSIGDFSRGIVRLPSILERIESGKLPRFLQIERQMVTSISGKVFTNEERNWPDQVGIDAAKLSSEIALEYGIGVVACPKPNILGEVIRPISNAGQVGMIFLQNSPLLNLNVSSENVIGNNPIAITAPGEPAFLFDASLSLYSLTSMHEKLKYQGTPPPVGALVDAHGNATERPEILQNISKGRRDQGALAPSGGIKGLGIAMGIEFIAGALTNGFFHAPAGKPWGEGALILAFDKKLFRSQAMSEHIQEYLNQFYTYPGKHAEQKRRQVMESGVIDYPGYVIDKLISLGEKYGIRAEL